MCGFYESKRVFFLSCFYAFFFILSDWVLKIQLQKMNVIQKLLFQVVVQLLDEFQVLLIGIYLHLMIIVVQLHLIQTTKLFYHLHCHRLLQEQIELILLITCKYFIFEIFLSYIIIISFSFVN